MIKNSLIVLKQSEDAAVTLVWLPHAGGSVAFFQELSDLLSPSIACLAVEYAGRGRRIRDPLSTDLMRTAHDVARSLATLPNKPYVLFGHSMGAVIGFEACRLLQSVGAKVLPKLLIVSACDPPHVPSDAPLLHRMSDAELIDTLISMGGVPLDKETSAIIQATLPTIRSDLAAGEMHRFIPLSRLDHDIAIYSGDKDSLVRKEAMPRWANLTWGDARTRSFDGGHFYMREQEQEFLETLENDVLGVLSRP